MSEQDHPHTLITFEGPSTQGKAPKISISGLAADYIKKPEKIRKLMELLDLPEGTKARIVSSVEDVVIR